MPFRLLLPGHGLTGDGLIQTLQRRRVHCALLEQRFRCAVHQLRSNTYFSSTWSVESSLVIRAIGFGITFAEPLLQRGLHSELQSRCHSGLFGAKISCNRHTEVGTIDALAGVVKSSCSIMSRT